MAVIYKAQDLRLKRIVAIKVLHSDLAEDPKILSRFIREAQSAAKLSHPNIVAVFDIEEYKNMHYIVMEYVEGENLKNIIRREASLNTERIYKFFQAICKGIKYAHQKGIIHRDIKPQNVLVAGEEIIKVTDFGIARAVTSSSMTQTGTLMGSVHYFSPEQAQGKPVDKTSDIYALGVVLFECATGKLPFDGENPITVALKQVQEPPPLPSSINSNISKELEKVIMKCLEKNPENRYQNIDEFWNDLKNALKNSKSIDSTLVMEDSPLKDVQKPKKRKKTKRNLDSFLYVFLLVLILGLITTVFWRRGVLKPVITNDTVPDLEGYSLAEARQVADKKGWRIRIAQERYDNKIPEGVIIAQSPKMGERLARGGIINVVISKGKRMVKVPNLVGLSVFEAQENLAKIGLKGVVQRQMYDDNYRKGVVISHDPSPNVMVTPGKKIYLVVSKGPKTTKVPNLLGLTREEAAKVASSYGLSVVVTSNEYSDKYPQGCIASQIPLAGRIVERGTSIKVVISRGIETIKTPNLIGKSIGEARSFLEPMGIKIDTVSDEVSEDSIITDQDPSPADPLSDKVIKVWTSEPLPSPTPMVLVPTPNLLGRRLEDAKSVLSESGLKVGKITYLEKPNIMDGVVMDQLPKVGDKVEKGSTVDLLVSKKVPYTTPVPHPSPTPKPPS